MAEKLGKFLGITTGVIYGLAAAYGSYVFVDPTRLIYNVVALISAAIYFTVTVFAFYKWYTLSGQSKQKEKN